MDSSTSICYLCDNAFDVDELQKFQPGFVLEWRSNLDLVKSSIKVPGSVPGLSPEGDPLIRPTLERRRTRKLGDGHVCEYDPYAADGRCVKCLEEHNFCCLLNSCSRCEVCHRASEECPEDESKSFFLSRRLLELVEQMPNLQFSTTNESSSRLNSRPLKVIVFSQFRAALNFVGDRLLRKFGTACVAEYFGSHRKQELQKFTSERCCFCLLLTKDGSEGLDLSFVTNIIFLEEVFDKSLEDQVVARAWRMGAKGSVIVETLIANNSVEETMSEHVQGPYDDDDVTRSSNDQHRLKSLLESLRFNTDHHHFSRPVAATSGEDDSRNDSYDGTLKRRLALPLTEGVIQSPKRLRQSVRFAE
jgi:SNF2 family DNA or RNA helicase